MALLMSMGGVLDTNPQSDRWKLKISVIIKILIHLKSILS